MGELSGKVAIVTGASKGIGAEIARQMSAAGARVVVNYARSAALAQAVVDQINDDGGEAVAIRADISDEGDCMALIEGCVACFGRLDIVVNNAAHFSFSGLEQLDKQGFRDHFEVNVLGPVLVARYALPHLSRGSAIVNIGSAGVGTPGPDAIFYAGSKYAIEKVTQFMAAELGPRGIRVNCVRPGATDTEGNREVGTLDNERMYDLLVSKTALGRFGTPADVAPAVLFFASDRAAWVTGATLDASGGFA